MKNESIRIGAALALTGAVAAAFAGSRSGGNYTINDTIDGGGQCATSASYRADGSIGGTGGTSSNAAPLEIAKHGYIGQLTEVTNVVVIATPGSVNEGGITRLGGIAGLDDATVAVVGGNEIAWSAPAYPVSSINAGGTATVAFVCADTPAAVTGRYLAVTGWGSFLVVDANVDNYGIYAGDQVPDWWQARYFGTNNPLGMAGATNCTGQNNLNTYTADLASTTPRPPRATTPTGRARTTCSSTPRIWTRPTRHPSFTSSRSRINRRTESSPSERRPRDGSTGCRTRRIWSAACGRTCRACPGRKAWPGRCRCPTPTRQRSGSIGSMCRRRRRARGTACPP